MKNELQITLENDYVKVIVKGEKTFDLAKKVWSGIVETCLANDCYKILGISNTTNPFSILERINHSELFNKLGINYKYRIAWVELNPEGIENSKFWENVFANRGLPGKAFTDVDEAKKWLLIDNI